MAAFGIRFWVLASVLFAPVAHAACGEGVAANCPASLDAAGVASIYQREFGRAPSASDTALWVGLSQTRTADQMAMAIAGSKTGRDLLTSIYTQNNGAAPDAATLNNFVTVLATQGLDATRSLIANTDAAASFRATSVAGFYQSILGTGAPDAATAQLEADHLKTETADQVKLEIASSPAGQALITQALTSKLGRAPTADEVAEWEQVLAKGGPNALQAALAAWSPSGSSVASFNLDQIANGGTGSSTGTLPTNASCLNAYNQCILAAACNTADGNANNTCRSNCTATQNSCLASAGSGSTATGSTASASGVQLTLSNPTSTTATTTTTAGNGSTSIASALTGGSTAGTATATNSGAVRNPASTTTAAATTTTGTTSTESSGWNDGAPTVIQTGGNPLFH